LAGDGRLRSLDRLAREGGDDVQYRIGAAEPSVHDAIAIADPEAPNRVRVMAGVVLGASLTVGALGLFVWRRTEEANRAISEAASAQASVDSRTSGARRRYERALASAPTSATSVSIGAGTPRAAGRPRRP
jgi:hypothetical protein